MNEVWIKCRECKKKLKIYKGWRKGKRKFCSRECYDKYRSKKKIKKKASMIKCEVCGKTFITYPSWKGRKYCSNECAYKGKKQCRTIEKCLNCGVEIYRRPSEVKNDRWNFCSKKCYYDYHSETRKCKYCGKEFTKRKSEMKQSGIYCSNKCCGKSKSERPHFCRKCGVALERGVNWNTYQTGSICISCQKADAKRYSWMETWRRGGKFKRPPYTPICRRCAEVLREGVTWYPTHKRHKNNICIICWKTDHSNFIRVKNPLMRRKYDIR